jgi:hypothetical protein
MEKVTGDMISRPASVVSRAHWKEGASWMRPVCSSRNGASSVRPYTSTCTHCLETQPGTSLAHALLCGQAPSRSGDALAASVALHEDNRFILAEPSFIEHIPSRNFRPTDPRFGEQWQWSNTGTGGGTAGADVSAEEAWDHTLGAGVRVAIIDNGFDADHEDLEAGVVASSGYFRPQAGGVPVFEQGTAGMPGDDHGTFCAGMVGARHNSGHGGCGGAPQSELMLVACLNDQVGTQTTLARAVGYAADPSTELATLDPEDGADILVCSLGPNGANWNLSSVLELAIENAARNGRGGRGLAIFWAASNGNFDVALDQVVSHEDVIAVVRSSRNDTHDNAAHGEFVELIAPGVNVFSTRTGNAYGTGTGTSYAAPCAAACAALALSVNPRMSRNQLRTIMQETADHIGGVNYVNGRHDRYGFGRVNAERAVLRAFEERALPPSGIYTIQQRSNLRFVDAYESSSNDFDIVTRPAQNNDSQRWVLASIGDVYTVQQLSSERFVDAHLSSTEDYSLVTRAAQHNDTQRWVLRPVDHTLSVYTIQSLRNGRFVDAHETPANDFSVVTRAAQNNDSQRWVLTPLGDDVYTIQQKSTGRFVDAHQSSASDFSIVTRTAQNNDTQRWALKLVGGLYTIQQRSTGRFADANETTEKDFSLMTRPANFSDSQRWVLLPSRGGSFTVQQLSTSRFKDAHESSPKDYSVVTRTAQDNDTQRWNVEPTCIIL